MFFVAYYNNQQINMIIFCQNLRRNRKNKNCIYRWDCLLVLAVDLILDNSIAAAMLPPSFVDLLVPGWGSIDIWPTFADLLVPGKIPLDFLLPAADLLVPGNWLLALVVDLLQPGCGTRVWFLIMLVGCSSLISSFSP